ncbi:hypothetical protein LQV63_17230 [Paenibacillus profundus]|uniref:DUF4306 domain-containing protein n=1 Tax=Paenibacillus profundus TaxID=1173085 RepID=A0ABS8YH29_9BACL|nr:hypothetical protein [Paenibacillus profundus]MCE5171046.1 hypothetical protein [Paenibacillus profundus]
MMKRINEILLAIYGIMILIFGVLYVPYHLIWGPEENIYDVKYAPLWKTIDYNKYINGFQPIYQLQLPKLVYEIFIITLVFLIIYLLFNNRKSNK